MKSILYYVFKTTDKVVVSLRYDEIAKDWKSILKSATKIRIRHKPDLEYSTIVREGMKKLAITCYLNKWGSATYKEGESNGN